MKTSIIARCFVLIVLGVGAAYSFPAGQLDYVPPTNTEFAMGWASDSSYPNESLQIHFYKEGAVFIGFTVANLPYPGHGNHGFRFRVPYTIYDGNPHTLYAFAINPEGGTTNNPQLTNSPASMHRAFAHSNSDARVVVSMDCGGAITQMYSSADWDKNMIMAHPGGALQVTLADGNADQNGDGNVDEDEPFWNPTQASDKYQAYTGFINASYWPPEGSLYIKSQPLQWVPEDWGGGSGNPVHGDVYLETITKLVGKVLYVRYEITNISGIARAAPWPSGQECPCVYVSADYYTAVTGLFNTYPLTDFRPYPKDINTYLSYSTEWWFGAINTSGIGPIFCQPNNDSLRENVTSYSWAGGTPVTPANSHWNPFGYMNNGILFGIPGGVGSKVIRNCAFYIGPWTEARAFQLNYNL